MPVKLKYGNHTRTIAKFSGLLHSRLFRIALIGFLGVLVLGTAIAVCLGAFGGRYMQNVPLKLVAGIGFIVIGLWSVVQYYQGE